jgi:hypothetical protein
VLTRYDLVPACTPSRSSERKDILIEQFDFDDERLEDTTEIVLDSHRAFRPDPSTPVTPLPGTPLVFDEAVSHRGTWTHRHWMRPLTGTRPRSPLTALALQ